MGFLSSARAAILRGLAQAMTPPLPPDITRWCEDNIVFDERSPFPSEFNIDRFPSCGKSTKRSSKGRTTAIR